MKKGDYESLLPPKEGSLTLTSLLSLQQENENGDERTPSTSTQWRGGLLNEMVPMCYCQGVSP
jgi:hypothetical protein